MVSCALAREHPTLAQGGKGASALLSPMTVAHALAMALACRRRSTASSTTSRRHVWGAEVESDEGRTGRCATAGIATHWHGVEYCACDSPPAAYDKLRYPEPPVAYRQQASKCSPIGQAPLATHCPWGGDGGSRPRSHDLARWGSEGCRPGRRNLLFLPGAKFFWEWHFFAKNCGFLLIHASKQQLPYRIHNLAIWPIAIQHCVPLQR